MFFVFISASLHLLKKIPPPSSSLFLYL
jgi:hypothetical protein